ncbi:MAG: tetratricopeptide repeat protein [Clostridiales bacterium]
MLDKNDRKRTIWVYAVVLFISAFIVLLITMYSQIKFSDSYETLKDQNSQNEEEVGKYKLNLSSAIKENEVLSEELKLAKEKLEEANRQIQTITKDDSKEGSGASIENYEILINAKDNFDRNEIVNTAIILKDVEYEILGENGQKLYNQLIEKTEKKALVLLYDDGIRNMEIGEYKVAIDKYSTCYNLSDSSQYADDCLYYLGYCEYKLDKNEDALMYLNELKNKFSKSSFLEDCNILIEKIKKEQDA